MLISHSWFGGILLALYVKGAIIINQGAGCLPGSPSPIPLSTFRRGEGGVLQERWEVTRGHPWTPTGATAPAPCKKLIADSHSRHPWNPGRGVPNHPLEES